MHADYVICQAKPEEVCSLGRIQLAAAARFSPDDLPDPMRSTYTVSMEILEDAIADGRLWVAKNLDCLTVGYAVWRCPDDIALLEQVDVLPEHGQRGLGRALVQRILHEAEARGYEALYLTTFSHVPWNAPFYRSLGFTEVPDADLPEYVAAMIQSERKAASKRIAMRNILR